MPQFRWRACQCQKCGALHRAALLASACAAGHPASGLFCAVCPACMAQILNPRLYEQWQLAMKAREQAAGRDQGA